MQTTCDHPFGAVTEAEQTNHNAVTVNKSLIVSAQHQLRLSSSSENQAILSLNASKMIMRPERETKEHRDPCPEQMDCRYGEGRLQESETVPENAAPHPRAAAQTYSGDDYVSRSVARPARAIQCGWRQDHKQAYTPGITAAGTR